MMNTEETTPFVDRPDTPPPRSRKHVRVNKHLIWSLVSLIFLLSILVLFLLISDNLPFSPWRISAEQTPQYHSLVAPLPPLRGPWEPSHYVKGPPTKRFRENLRPDIRYITGFLGGGWTNDVMTYVNMIYLALLTQRVPIVGTFSPTHIGYNESLLHFGEVFDVQRLGREIKTPVLEWRDVKDESSKQVELVGCWSPWAATGTDGQPRGNGNAHHFGIDVSYTRTPHDSNLLMSDRNDWHVKFWPLAELGFPDGRSRAIAVAPGPTSSNILHGFANPDEHILCYDFLYFAVENRQYEWELDFSPAWRFVGRHLHWSDKVKDLAREYLRRIFGVEGPNAEIPPFIAVHARRNDFEERCEPEVPLEECLPSISVFARRVEEVRAELLEKRGITVEHVLMTSDETDPEWWADVQARGWYFPDHPAELTAEKYGKWYLPVLDAAFQSMGSGFVGTYYSTMSTVARRRVETWNNGISRIVMWGTRDADDH
ncbi:hypothetical protein BOTBODRAFT_301821 [Botryobasidium botryosum FD-172 SS1]|uniref:Uncharacterized protein n=1 Tax=Botryobasidium botryosum (strain FD-172 SS1) TaxID=930990 RepID=A0A067MK40_BOTB1|nr:hypothetical protein BOTBODRAFT_301821 [Botryobasidium botryosum FD-172 SS1]